MTPLKEKSRQSAEYYHRQYNATTWEHPRDAHAAKGRIYRRIKALTKFGLARGLTEADVAARLAGFGLGYRHSVTAAETKQINREALDAAFSEWRALPE
jgi:hypothetical protein